MNGRTLMVTLLLACPVLSVAAAKPGDGKLLGAADGLMYSRAKFTCDSLPADLVSEYVKASRLIAGPSAEYDEAYEQMASREDRWPAIPNAADRALECEKSKQDLAIKAKLAQRWHPEAYR